MSAFRLAPVHESRTRRVYHTDHAKPVACLCPCDEGGVDLVPVLMNGAPVPLTGREQHFDTFEAAADYLGIPADAREARAA